MTQAVLSIGSNLLDRQGYLQLAVDEIHKASHTDTVSISAVYETAPVGGPAQQDFLNMILIVETTLDAHALLEFTQGIEHEAQRERIEHWGPRTLDVDIIDFGGAVIDDEDLSIPHPRAHERGFVLIPWLSVDPDALVVGHGRVEDLIKDISFVEVRERRDVQMYQEK